MQAVSLISIRLEQFKHGVAALSSQEGRLSCGPTFPNDSTGGRWLGACPAEFVAVSRHHSCLLQLTATNSSGTARSLSWEGPD